MTDSTEQRVLEKVQKLLSHAQGTTNAEEAATYTARAMELMEAYNLDQSQLDETSASDGGRRADEKFRGGFYEYERDLWHRVADLNFCIYWSTRVREERTVIDERARRLVSWEAQYYVWRRHHRIVGRQINIVATRTMMDYLLGAIERHTREWLGDNLTTGLRSRRAVSFREGMAAEISGRLWDRRQTQIAEEEAQAEQARRDAERAGMAGASSSTALTISSVRKSERDANMDHVMGEGYSARKAERIARQAEAERRAEEEHTRWAAANPEEAARQERQRQARERRRASRPRRERAERERDWGAYSAGYDRGSEISLDQQVSRRDERALPSS